MTNALDTLRHGRRGSPLGNDMLSVSSAFTPAAPPEVPPATKMPVPGQDDLANIAARRRSVAAQLARRGRLSTILSQPQSEPLGGTA